MNFDGQNIVPGNEVGGVDGAWNQGPSVISRVLRGRIKGDGAGVHVAAEHLVAIQMDDHAVITSNLQPQDGIDRGICDREGMPEIGGDVFVVGRAAKADHGGLVAIPVSELRRSAAPCGVIE